MFIRLIPECCRNSSAVAAAQCKFLTRSKLSLLIERTEIEMTMKEATLPSVCVCVCVLNVRHSKTLYASSSFQKYASKGFYSVAEIPHLSSLTRTNMHTHTQTCSFLSLSSSLLHTLTHTFLSLPHSFSSSINLIHTIAWNGHF